MSFIGEIYLVLSLNVINLKLDSLVVNNLNVEILAGMSFMFANDISVQPAKYQTIIGDLPLVQFYEKLNIIQYIVCQYVLHSNNNLVKRVLCVC